MDKEGRIKVIVLGDGAVGKSSIIQRIKNGIFQDSISGTIHVDIYVIHRKYEKKNIIIAINFYDMTGYELYENFLFPEYIRDSHIVLLVFCDINTLHKLINRWYTFYKKYVNIENSSFILIGNKSDTFGNEGDEIIKQGNKFAEEIDALFITCSAKSGDNMDNLDRFITKEAKRFFDEEEKGEKYHEEEKRKNYYEEHPKKKSGEEQKIKFAEEYL